MFGRWPGPALSGMPTHTPGGERGAGRRHRMPCRGAKEMPGLVRWQSATGAESPAPRREGVG
jgi:hypothetical protein